LPGTVSKWQRPTHFFNLQVTQVTLFLPWDSTILNTDSSLLHLH
jgi:hypothetical protein